MANEKKTIIVASMEAKTYKGAVQEGKWKLVTNEGVEYKCSQTPAAFPPGSPVEIEYWTWTDNGGTPHLCCKVVSGAANPSLPSEAAPPPTSPPKGRTPAQVNDLSTRSQKIDVLKIATSYAIEKNLDDFSKVYNDMWQAVNS